MNPWFESLAAALAALFAFGLGRWFSRLPRPWWAVGYFIPLGLIVLYCVAIFEPWLTIHPPISWMLMGRSRFVSFNFVTTMLLAAPLGRLPQKRNRAVVCLLIFVLSSLSVLPFLAPAFNHRYLAGLKTRIDADGVCRQSNDYTCGPAAAVTALRKLGLPAEEGEIAILARANSLTGTDPEVLAKALQNRYRADGLEVEYRAFKDIEDLKRAGLTVAVLRFNALQDHCVAVLGVEGGQITVGDPLIGLSKISSEEFESQWEFAGIALQRVAARPQNR